MSGQVRQPKSDLLTASAGDTLTGSYADTSVGAVNIAGYGDITLHCTVNNAADDCHIKIFLGDSSMTTAPTSSTGYPVCSAIDGTVLELVVPVATKRAYSVSALGGGIAAKYLLAQVVRSSASTTSTIVIRLQGNAAMT